VSETADQLEARAEVLLRATEELLDRVRELRADRRTIPQTLGRLADATGISVGVLRAGAVSGALPACRAGGAERGEIVTTLANVETWLAKQPARGLRVVAPVADDASAAVAAAARRVGARK
jgi:hypothetical protein